MIYTAEQQAQDSDTTSTFMAAKKTYADPFAENDHEGIAQAALDSFEEQIAIIDKTGRIVAVNTAWENFPDRQPAGVLDRPPIGTNYLARLRRHNPSGGKISTLIRNVKSLMRGHKGRFTVELPSHTGSKKRWLQLSVTRLLDGGEPAGAVLTYSDITGRKLAELAARKHSMTDQMTGILNRRAGLEALRKQIKLCERHGRSFTACYIDLDNLKLVNDSYGHKEGDRVITTVVKLISGVLRESDVMCRLGGDELLLILHETTLEGSGIVLKRIHSAVDARNSRNKKPYGIEFSYGLAEYTPGCKRTAEDLVDMADRDMYRMKLVRKTVALSR